MKPMKDRQLLRIWCSRRACCPSSFGVHLPLSAHAPQGWVACHTCSTELKRPASEAHQGAEPQSKSPQAPSARNDSQKKKFRPITKKYFLQVWSKDSPLGLRKTTQRPSKRDRGPVRQGDVKKGSQAASLVSGKAGGRDDRPVHGLLEATVTQAPACVTRSKRRDTGRSGF
jgi:hypothetical protein